MKNIVRYSYSKICQAKNFLMHNNELNPM